MTVAADDHAGRAKAVQVLLVGLTRAPEARRNNKAPARKPRAQS